MQACLGVLAEAWISDLLLHDGLAPELLCELGLSV